MIEAKWKDDKLTPHFDFFARDIAEPIKKIQIVRYLEREKMTALGHEIRRADSWLKSL